MWIVVFYVSLSTLELMAVHRENDVRSSPLLCALRPGTGYELDLFQVRVAVGRTWFSFSLSPVAYIFGSFFSTTPQPRGHLGNRSARRQRP